MQNSETTNYKKQLFNRWAPSYDWLFPSVFYQAIHKRLLEYVNLPDNAQVLDLGCGTGQLLNRIASKYPHLYGIGADFSPEMLRGARWKNKHHPRLIFVERNAESLNFATGQFDAIFNTISFLHYPNPEKVLAEVYRVLCHGGSFYLVDFTLSQKSRLQKFPVSPGGVHFYSPKTREELGQKVGLSCRGHYYLLGPVLLTVFGK